MMRSNLPNEFGEASLPGLTKIKGRTKKLMKKGHCQDCPPYKSEKGKKKMSVRKLAGY